VAPMWAGSNHETPTRKRSDASGKLLEPAVTVEAPIMKPPGAELTAAHRDAQNSLRRVEGVQKVSSREKHGELNAFSSMSRYPFNADMIHEYDSFYVVM
jgi:hypothetical protein